MGEKFQGHDAFWHLKRFPRTNSAPSALIRNLVLYNRPRPTGNFWGWWKGWLVKHHGFTKGGH